MDQNDAIMAALRARAQRREERRRFFKVAGSAAGVDAQGEADARGTGGGRREAELIVDWVRTEDSINT